MRFGGGRPIVVVLGAGPAGLLAAHAAELRGCDVRVYSATKNNEEATKSELHGCQYLHQYIPYMDLDMTGTLVRYSLSGDADAYRRKVYGDSWNGSVSPDEYGPEKDHEAWDLRKVYDMLWEQWKERIWPLNMTPKMAERLHNTRGQRVICTIPAPVLCLDPETHKFVSQSIWAMGSTIPTYRWTDEPLPADENFPLPYVAQDMTVECNGEDAPRWYRAATVFGQSTLEWPAGPKPPVRGVVAVHKPLKTDCTCHMGNRWYRLGRFGKWEKGYLVHQAFTDTMDLLK
jgi:hypothetical protein